MKTFTRALGFLFCFSMPVALFAQASGEEELTQEAIKANKKLIVGVNMDLSDQEKEGFWPVYEEYQEALRKINEKTVNLIKDYAAHYNSLSDEKAESLLNEYLKIQEERLQLQNASVGKFNKVLPPQKVVRYYQVENKIKAIIDYELVKEIPLAKVPEE